MYIIHIYIYIYIQDPLNENTAIVHTEQGKIAHTHTLTRGYNVKNTHTHTHTLEAHMSTESTALLHTEKGNILPIVNIAFVHTDKRTNRKRILLRRSDVTTLKIKIHT